MRWRDKCECGHPHGQHGRYAGCHARLSGPGTLGEFCPCMNFTQAKGEKDGTDRGASTSDFDSAARAAAGSLAALGAAFSSSSNAAPGAGEDSGLEVVEQDEPIRAWRVLAIVAYGNDVRLQSLNAQFGWFAASEETAKCRAMTLDARHYIFPPPWTGSLIENTAHEAPDVKCQCGFYGVKDKASLGKGTIAEVDLYGRVIEHELGYRAQYQRVLSIRLWKPPTCLGEFLCPGEPTMLWFPDDQPMTAICETCAMVKTRVASLSKLAARLGVEVRWDD